MGRPLALLLTALLLAVVSLASTSTGTGDDDAAAPPAIRAGVATVDATWHVGASAGQYTDPRSPELEGDLDPHAHHYWKRKSYGVQSRLTIRALVVEGSNGEKVALVKSDNYLAQDHLLRRVGQLLEERGSGVAYANILHAASHNHSSPYYSTPSWGVWLFQDVMDLRMFEYQARRMADAIEQAEANLAPARMGATEITHDVYKGNIMRPQTADDGSPAGFPADYGDSQIAVLRFDRWAPETEAGWEPMAVWLNHGQHPESLDSYDLITADFLAPLERFVEQGTGATLVFSQGDVGSAEGPYDGWDRGRRDDGTLVAWAHVGHAQTERGARLLADTVVEAYEAIGRGDADVPFTSDFEVEAYDGWVPGPVSHPYPSVSNCRSEPTVGGDPGAPILGLPDCERPGTGGPYHPAWENLKAHGIPVAEHYDAPSFTGVEENLRLRLQVIKLGDVVLGSCACEAQVDLIKNFESRANDVEGDIHDGFDWTEEERTACSEGDGTWTCVHDGPLGQDRTWTFSASAYDRMLAQIHNDAAGWDSVEYAPYANSEPEDPEAILGNFTKEELPTEQGYKLAIGVGHAGDYNGYTVSYREYMGYDHYRKALTSHGAHTADYMVTRMVRMAGELNGGPAYAGEPHQAMAEADEARQLATSQALGRAAGAAYDAWLAGLPDDAGPAEAIEQPADITRFDAATFSWRGGSNAIDNPVARVERLVDGEWVFHGGMLGEVQTMVDFPDGLQGVADTYTGSQEWVWTANFEAFTGGPDPSLENTPPGTYRFVVDGNSHQGGAIESYTVTSQEFRVKPWGGITVEDLTVDAATGTISFRIADVVGEDSRAARYGLAGRYDVAYPTTYESAFPFVADDGHEEVCNRCFFRPWAFGNDIASATVTVTRIVDGAPTDLTYEASEDGERWVVEGVELRALDRVRVGQGDVVDVAGNHNGAPSPTLVIPPS